MPKPKNIRKTKKYTNSAKPRQVNCYPPVPILTMLNNYAKDERMSKSEATVHMMKCFFKSLPAEVVERYRRPIE